MSATIRVLSQAYPSAGTETVFYTCANISAVISSLLICNTGGTTDLVSARICIGGASDTNAQLLCSNIALYGNSLLDLTAGLTVANSDVIKVTSQNGTSAFQLFGQENN